jgi:hypothetical protein
VPSATPCEPYAVGKFLHYDIAKGTERSDCFSDLS